MKEPIVYRIIGLRPEQVPEGWAIYNAPRPLYGDKTWQGDFVHGVYYVAIAPHTPATALFREENALSDAWELEYVLPEAAIAEQMTWYEEHAPGLATQIDLNDTEIREKVIVGWRNRQRVEYPPRGGEAL
jgi:hypothetical protein